jgi:modification target Cys-rich repeat protein
MTTLKVPNSVLNRLDQILQQLTEVFTLAELKCTEPILMGRSQCECAGSCKGTCKKSCKGIFMY